MTPRPPVPVVKTFLLCRELFQDVLTKEYFLIGPTSDIRAPELPWVAHAGVYIELTSGHGSYRPSLQLRDLSDRIVWHQTFEQPFPAQDPLRVTALAFFRVGLCVPALGRYDLVFLLNDQEVARRPVMVGRPTPPSPPPADEE
jgi:hypothetical protein